ncbi:hypothetical protein [Corynebacterium minutissimum]|uniref:Membrane-bound metallopeptidase n=1 Tax=Corynebacterium minutissimum TaxID=38301 RepID=A0A376D1K1_9CORY|nr:hypothetical protein [Corynebacterium minutissimum]QRP61480.1 hypothetical protein I6J26_02725 [Corynebacterium minutissimum]STC79957.1 Membrane-bound metallopeptidase [Corynebacterium minutissimum]
MQFRRKLPSGKTLSTVAILSGLCFCIAIYGAKVPVLRYFFIAGVAGAILCSIGTLWWMKVSYSSLKELIKQAHFDSQQAIKASNDYLLQLEAKQNEQNNLTNSLRHFRKQVNSSLSTLTDDLKATDSNISAVQDSLRSKLDQIQDLQRQQHLRDLERDREQALAKPTNFFAPNQIPPVEIIAKPDAFTAGRQAANQTMAGGAETSLQSILNGTSEEYERHLTGIITPALLTALQDVGRFSPIYPGQGQGEISADTCYFIIEEKALKTLPWRGVLDTSNTNLFLRLVELIKQAQRQHAVVAFIKDETPTAFTGTIQHNSDLVISKDSSDFKWERDCDLPVVGLLRDYAEGK